MSELIKIAAIGLGAGMLSLTLRRERPEFAIMVSLAASAVILLGVSRGIESVIGRLERLSVRTGVDIKYFTVCIKAVGMAYIAQFAAELLRDSGESAIAAKVETAGKIAILVMTVPIMEGLLDMCIRAVNSI